MLASFAVGSRWMTLVLYVGILLDGLFSVLSLNLVGIHQYFSGSINYLTEQSVSH